jgi:phenylpyruvate tautomerase PptA (4-oxalocrotonate tautomerase family)
MPLVKIEVKKGWKSALLIKLRDAVMDCVIRSLHIPPDDRNVRILEYPVDYFQMKPPYELLIEITLFTGRTRETKKSLYNSIVQKLDDELNIEKEKIFIVLNEQPMDNWGIRGGIPADESSLDFKVDI